MGNQASSQFGPQMPHFPYFPSFRFSKEDNSLPNLLASSHVLVPLGIEISRLLAYWSKPQMEAAEKWVDEKMTKMREYVIPKPLSEEELAAHRAEMGRQHASVCALRNVWTFIFCLF